jgi:mRNA interferase MazF
MDKYLKGDVCFVDLNPPQGSEMAKERRCVIVSNNIINEYSSVIIICPITDAHGKTSPIHIPVSPPQGRLTKESVVHCGQIRAIDKNRIKNKTGELSSSIMEQIEKGICTALDIIL